MNYKAAELLPDTFWSEFVDEYWERKPGVFKGLIGVHSPGVHDLFNALVSAAIAKRRGEATKFALWRNDALPVPRHTIDLLPKAQDQTLEKYLTRVCGTPASDTICLAQFNLQAYSADLWRFGRSFIGGLLQEVGLPDQQVDMDTIVGAYQITPRGIHTDLSSTFMIVVEGRKRILTWPPEYFDQFENHITGSAGLWELTGLEIQSFIDDAIVLEGEAGDVFYWPSSYWHVGLSEDAFNRTAVLNIGLFYNFHRRSILEPCIEQLLSTVMAEIQAGRSYPANLKSAHSSAQQLPPAERMALNILRSAECGITLSGMLQEAWLKRVTGMGFLKLPPPAAIAELQPETRLVPSTEFPLAWIHVDQQILVSAGGYVERFQHDPGILALLMRVGNAQVFTVSEIEGEFSTLRIPATQILRALCRIRAIEKNGYPSAARYGYS